MRRKRLLLLAFVAVLAVALGLISVVVFSPTPGVTQENYGRITYGMTLAEVQGLLGGEGEEPELIGNTYVRTWRRDGLTVDISPGRPGDPAGANEGRARGK
jgi:hypothetical protein